MVLHHSGPGDLWFHKHHLPQKKNLKMNECPLKREQFKRKMVFQPAFFWGHVSFREGTLQNLDIFQLTRPNNFSWKRTHLHKLFQQIWCSNPFQLLGPNFQSPPKKPLTWPPNTARAIAWGFFKFSGRARKRFLGVRSCGWFFSLGSHQVTLGSHQVRDFPQINPIMGPPFHKLDP